MEKYKEIFIPIEKEEKHTVFMTKLDFMKRLTEPVCFDVDKKVLDSLGSFKDTDILAIDISIGRQKNG